MSDWTPPDAGDGWAPPDAGGSPPPPPAWPAPASPPPGDDGAWSGGRLIPLRPLRYGEMLDASVRLLRTTFVQVAVLVLLTLGAFTLLQSLVAPAPPGLLDDPATFEEAFGAASFARFGVAGLLAVVTQLFVLPLVRGAATGIAVEADRGGDTSWQAGLATARRLAGRLLGLSFALLGLGIVALLVVGAVVALPVVLLADAGLVAVAVVYGVVAGLGAALLALAATALVYLAVPVLLVEGERPIAALRRSIALVRPQFWRMVGMVVVTGLLVLVVSMVLGVLTVPFQLVGGLTAQLAAAVLSTLAYVVTLPFQANVALLLYVDARVRVEGLDVAVLTAELEQL